MATGIASAVADDILDAYCSGTDYVGNTQFWVKLHLGDPGAAGASNPATETDRIQATFSAASGGAITNSAELLWEAVAASETYSHVSFWDASTNGTFLGSDALEASKAVTAGEDFRIAAGALDITLGAIAA